MKFIRTYLVNESNIVIGALFDKGNYIRIEDNKGPKMENDLVYYCPEKQTIVRVFKEKMSIKKRVFHISSIPGDNFSISFFEGQQTEIEMDDIISLQTIPEIIKKEEAR